MPGFDGQIKSLVYSSPLPSARNIGAFFVAIAGRVTVQMVSDEYGIESNPIVLQLAPPEQVTDQGPGSIVTIPDISGYLILDDPAGRTDVYRLAGAPLPPITVNDRAS